MRQTRCTRMSLVALCIFLLSALCITLPLTACSSGGRSHKKSKSITVAGSTTVLPIAEMGAEKFEEKTGNRVLVSGLGSSAGIESAINGTADIASSSRELTEEESKHGLVETVIAHDGIAIIINEKNPVKKVSLDELRDIYAGIITNWSEVGGPDLPIQLVNRDEASGTREAFRSIVMRGTAFDRRAAILPGTGQVRDVVSRSQGAIGYISIGFVESEFASTSVSTLMIDDVEPTKENVQNGSYPIARDLFFFTKGKPSGAAADYIKFIGSDTMKKTIIDAGYIPVTEDESLSFEEQSQMTGDKRSDSTEQSDGKEEI